VLLPLPMKYAAYGFAKSCRPAAKSSQALY